MARIKTIENNQQTPYLEPPELDGLLDEVGSQLAETSMGRLMCYLDCQSKRIVHLGKQLRAERKKNASNKT